MPGKKVRVCDRRPWQLGGVAGPRSPLLLPLCVHPPREGVSYRGSIHICIRRLQEHDDSYGL